jgi:2-dehydropantoate 2-reductase
MRIAVFGTGGAGGYFGAQLARAGEEVSFIARGAHLTAIRTDGLRLSIGNDESVIRPALATDDPGEVGHVDAVLVGVKTWQVNEAAHAIAPMVGAETFVVPLQNGVEAAGQLAAALGVGHVLGGLCGTLSWVEGPGHIRSLGTTHFVKFGELDNRHSERTERLRQAFERAGVNAQIPADIHVALWEKFLFVVSWGGVGAVTRAPVGVTRSVPETRRMIEQGMREILALARARDVGLRDTAVERAMAIVDALAPDGTASLQRDIAAGRPSELDAWSGAVARLGRDAEANPLMHEFIYHSLLPLELRARGQIRFSAA